MTDLHVYRARTAQLSCAAALNVDEDGCLQILILNAVAGDTALDQVLR